MEDLEDLINRLQEFINARIKEISRYTDTLPYPLHEKNLMAREMVHNDLLIKKLINDIITVKALMPIKFHIKVDDHNKKKGSG